jgi:hypothetical protein
LSATAATVFVGLFMVFARFLNPFGVGLDWLGAVVVTIVASPEV